MSRWPRTPPEPDDQADRVIRYEKDAKTRIAVIRPDADGDFTLDDAIQHGLGDAVKDNDDKFPPEWRLSKKGRGKKDSKGKRKH